MSRTTPHRAALAALAGLGLVVFGARAAPESGPADEPWSTNRQLTLNQNGAPHAMPAIAAAGNQAWAAWFDCTTFIRQAPGCLPFIGVAEWTGLGALSTRASASDNFVARKAFPSIAVDGAGTAYAIWLDGRTFSGEPANGDKADVFFSFRPPGGNWMENVRVNQPAGSAHWVQSTDLQVDERGNAAAVWVDGGAGESDIFFSYRPTGGSWSGPVPVDDSPPAGPRLQPAVAIDPTGNNAVVWVENGALRFAERPFGGRWSPSIRLDDGLWYVSDPDIAVDAAGNAHAVWTGSRSGPASWTLFYRTRPARGPWQPAEWLDLDAAGYEPWRTGASIDTNEDGDVYLAWLQIESIGGIRLPSGNVRFAFRPAGGVWGASELVNDGCCALDRISLAVDDEGAVHAAWTDDRNLHSDPDLYRQDIYSASRERPEVGEKLKVQGRVYGAPDASADYPVIGAPVALLRGQRVIRRALSLPPDGHYVLDNVPHEDDLVISTTLKYAAASPPTFRIMYGRSNPPLPVHLRTYPLQLAKAGREVTQNLVFSDSNGLDVDARIQPEDLASLAVVYYHTRQAALLAESLGQRLDLKLPVDVVTFSRDKGVFWRGPVTLYPDTVSRDPFINLESADAASYYLDSDTPTNREWHEFGHHVMADAFGNWMPWAPDTTNHEGYNNSYSTDSWVEGFAEFYSMLVGQEIVHSLLPSLYTVSGSRLDMENNYLAWNNEEFAVAGLLWDLQDPAKETDATFFGTEFYSDYVAGDFRSLWALLTRDWGDTVGRSPYAPAGYGHIFDVKHLYDILTEAGIGAPVPAGSTLSQLEQLFVAHGLFNDANGNKRFDVDERIGQVASKKFPTRRKAPQVQGSYVDAAAVDDATGAAVPIHDFSVGWCFAPPLDDRDYAWRQRLDPATGRLYFYGPDPQFTATAYVVANAPGYQPSAALGIQNADYWRLMAAEPSEFFLQHTFRLKRGGIYLPIVRKERIGAGLANHGLPPGAQIAAGTPVSAVGVTSVGQPLAACGAGPRPSPVTPATPDPSFTGTATPEETEVPTATPDRIGTAVAATLTALAPTPGATMSPLPMTSPAPTVTATGTASPPPPATDPAQHVTGVTTTDTGNRTRTAFVAGDTVWLWGQLVNDAAQAVETDVEFTVMAESGFVAEGLSWHGKLTLSPGSNWFRVERTVGADVPAALYHLSVTVTVGDRWTARDGALVIARSLIRSDDFSNAGSGWPTGSSADAEYGYAAGEYRIRIHSAEKTLWATNGSRAEDVVLEGDVRIATGSGAAALLLGLSDDGNDFSIFGIDSAGRYGLYRSMGGTWRDRVPWTVSPSVPPVGAPGHLMLLRRGDRLRLFLGGTELAEPAAEAIPAGRVGFYAEARQPDLEARFDNFRAYGP